LFKRTLTLVLGHRTHSGTLRPDLWGKGRLESHAIHGSSISEAPICSRKALARHAVSIAVKAVRVTGLMPLEKRLSRPLCREVGAVPIRGRL